MGSQSARVYFNGKDHKDLVKEGYYHDIAYIGKKMVWEKYYPDAIYMNRQFNLRIGTLGNVVNENNTLYFYRNGVGAYSKQAVLQGIEQDIETQTSEAVYFLGQCSGGVYDKHVVFMPGTMTELNALEFYVNDICKHRTAKIYFEQCDKNGVVTTILEGVNIGFYSTVNVSFVEFGNSFLISNYDDTLRRSKNVTGEIKYIYGNISDSGDVVINTVGTGAAYWQFVKTGGKLYGVSLIGGSYSGTYTVSELSFSGSAITEIKTIVSGTRDTYYAGARIKAVGDYLIIHIGGRIYLYNTITEVLSDLGEHESDCILHKPITYINSIKKYCYFKVNDKGDSFALCYSDNLTEWRQSKFLGIIRDQYCTNDVEYIVEDSNCIYLIPFSTSGLPGGYYLYKVTFDSLILGTNDR